MRTWWGVGGQTLSLKYLKNSIVNLFQTLPIYSYYHCRQFAQECILFRQVTTATLK